MLIDYEEANQELTVFLWELCKNIDLSRFTADNSDDLNKYISVAIKNQYIKLSKQKALDDQCLADVDTFELFVPYEDLSFKNIEFVDALKYLTDTQKYVIISFYVYGFSCEEIGKRLNITRQSVNKTKLRSLQILKDKWIGR